MRRRTHQTPAFWFLREICLWRYGRHEFERADLRSLSFQSVPYTMIIDKNGKVAFSHTGYEEGGDEKGVEFARKKPIVAVKSGRSAAGTRAAASHSAVP